jgi:hypothetical protein
VDYRTKQSLVQLSRQRRDAVSDAKGQEYTQTGAEYTDGGDVLTNFKRNAERFGQNPFTVLGVYMGKHFDSIENFIKQLNNAESYEDAVQLAFSGEGIISRLDDAANYLDLLEALLYEYELHPFSFGGDDGEATTESPALAVVEDESLDMPSDDLAAEVEAEAKAELVDFVGPASPFKGTREVGNG